MFDSRVQVDPRVTDYWGIPVVRLSGTNHPHTVELGKMLATKADAWLKEAGAVSTWPRPPRVGLSGGQHQAGTCRMGNDPKTSVVNRYCQVHDVDNLFVVDGSCFPSIGGFNPALTIQANAFRVSAYIMREWKGGAFRTPA